MEAVVSKSSYDFYAVKLAVKAGFHLIIKKVPALSFLFAGPIGVVLGILFGQVLNVLVELGIVAIDVFMIAKKVKLQEKDFVEVLGKALKTIDKKVYSEEEKQKYRNEIGAVFERFARYNAGL